MRISFSFSQLPVISGVPSLGASYSSLLQEEGEEKVEIAKGEGKEESGTSIDLEAFSQRLHDAYRNGKGPGVFVTASMDKEKILLDGSASQLVILIVIISVL